MLITSRETQRLILPKGYLISGLAPHQAAAQEAFEEAGLIGEAAPDAIGEYRYLKRERDGATQEMTVAVFPLAVREQLTEWPEQHERARGWFPQPVASRLVEEPDLARLILRFKPADVEVRADGHH